MKPLPLLLSLFGIGLLAALLLTQRTPPANEQTSLPNGGPLASSPRPLDQEADEEEPPPLAIPQPPTLDEDLVPDSQLIAFVEHHLGLTFSEPPLFIPVGAEEVINTIEEGFAAALTTAQLEELNIISRRLGLLPGFQQVDQNLITILAGEVRGLITPTRNLILNDFQASSPPEQAALVNLLAQRLISQELLFQNKETSIDQAIARHYSMQSLAFSTEKAFRKTLPNYPASLNENLRESILLGLPNFFHELSTFAEFHLWEKQQSSKPADTLVRLSLASATPSRTLLAFPFKPDASPAHHPSHLGAIPLYLILLEATDPTTARTIATDLIGDSIAIDDDILTWTLTFSSQKSPPRAAEFFRSYFSLRDPERKIKIAVALDKLLIQSQ